MKPIRSMLAAAAALTLVFAGCGDDDEDVAATVTTTVEGTGSASTLSITSPVDGAEVAGNVVSLDLASSGISIVKADGDTSGASGHYHVFIDKDPVAPGAVIPTAADIVHSAVEPISLPGLSVGSHRLVVVLGDGTHTRIGSAQAEATLKVTGPSIDASAPATVAVGQPVVVTAKVEGLSLVKADGDTSGKTGHLHVFVDRDPTAAGQPIPVEAGIIHSAATTIEVPGLAAGTHTLWVLAGDGTHTPIEPRVLDKVTVTVA